MGNAIRMKFAGGGAFLLVIGLFVLASFLAERFGVEIEQFVAIGGSLGVLGYIAITVLAVVIAPISTLPLLPVATTAWGWFLAGLYSVIGWSIGAQIAFMLARRYGRSFIQKFITVEKLTAIEGRISKRYLFVSVVLLRMTLPVDVLSYALGLFSQIKAVPYFLATLIGITPFAFIFAYAGTLPIIYQIEAGIALLFFLSLVYVKTIK